MPDCLLMMQARTACWRLSGQRFSLPTLFVLFFMAVDCGCQERKDKEAANLALHSSLHTPKQPPYLIIVSFRDLRSTRSFTRVHTP